MEVLILIENKLIVFQNCCNVKNYNTIKNKKNYCSALFDSKDATEICDANKIILNSKGILNIGFR